MQVGAGSQCIPHNRLPDSYLAPKVLWKNKQVQKSKEACRASSSECVAKETLAQGCREE